MEIPGSGIINRYIAAQGPLPETSYDFWEMMWEQRSSLVVMLTTNVERGRVKCHKYWPDVDETSQFEHLTVKCLTETSSDNGSYLLRHFTLHHDSVSELSCHLSGHKLMNSHTNMFVLAARCMCHKHQVKSSDDIYSDVHTRRHCAIVVTRL